MIEQAINMVANAKTLVVDTETSGLNPRRNYPVGYVFTVGPDSVYVPVRHGGGGNQSCGRGIRHELDVAEVEDPGELPNHSFEEALADLFRSRRTKGEGWTVVGHNLKFDVHFFAQRGIFLGRSLSCTQNNQALLDEYTRSFSLEKLATRYGVPAKLGAEMYEHLAAQFGGPSTSKAMSNFWRLAGNDPVAQAYAAGDGITTQALYEKQQAELDATGVGAEVRRVENELIWTLYRMESRGIKLDMEYLASLKAEMHREIKAARSALPDGFNVLSSKQVRELMESNGVSGWPVTDKGNPSFTEGFLKKSEPGRRILTVRKWSNLLNTFVEPLFTVHAHNGRVYPTINQNKGDDYGTISGRLSCSAPNLTAVPKHNKELARKFRRAFVADDGRDFCEADWSQCEPRLFAHYSKEPALLDGYGKKPFRDVHTVVAELFNADRNTVAKRMNMGMFTGMYPPTFAQHMGIPLDEAKRLWGEWFRNFPAIKGFQDAASRVILTRGYVRTLLGRHCRIENKRLAYKATSKIIQGGNADILKYKMVEIDKWLEARGDYSELMMTVHDSFIWQSPQTELGREESEAITAMMIDVQSPPFSLRVPFTVDFDKGPNWAVASFGEEPLTDKVVALTSS